VVADRTQQFTSLLASYSIVLPVVATIAAPFCFTHHLRFPPFVCFALAERSFFLGRDTAIIFLYNSH